MAIFSDRRLFRTLRRAAACCLTIFAASCNSFFYAPDRELRWTPEQFGFERKDLVLESPDGTKLSGWWIRSKTGVPARAVILQFHGNAENMTTHFSSLVWMVNEGFDLVTFDYRGYGSSEGSPYPAGVNMDAVTALNYVHEECRKSGRLMIVYGQSLGGAIALRAVSDMQSRKQVAMVVAESTFSSYKEITRQKVGSRCIFPFPAIAGGLMSDEFSAVNSIPAISPIPLIVIHGDQDPVVEFEHGRRIFELARDPKIFLEIRNGGHLNWMKFGRSENAKEFLKLVYRVLDKKQL